MKKSIQNPKLASIRITQVANLFFSMEKRTAQIQDLRERQGENTLVRSKAPELGSAAFIEEIWGSNLGGIGSS